MPDTTLAFCIGSNIEPEANIRRALAELRRKFGPLRCSRVYRNAAVGFAGPDFLNLAALAETGQSPAEVVASLKQVERRLGRNADQPGYASRPIDIDLFVPGMTSELTVSHEEILENAFILCPLAELFPEHRLEANGPSLAELWARHDKSRQPLELLTLDLPC